VNLVRLGERDDAFGRIWHLPSPETRTTREVVALVYEAAGTTPRLRVMPPWPMRALGLVNRTVREINEMRYEFDEPFIVDASRAETELGLLATPLAAAIEQTVRWYREPEIPSSAADSNGTEEVASATASRRRHPGLGPLAERYGERFAPPASLVERDELGEIYSAATRPRRSSPDMPAYATDDGRRRLRQ
jgi:hypothetical protein